MLPKLIMVILVVGATASALLVNRQQRIETFHEMSLIHHRMLDHETTLWQLRGQIANRCRPEQVRAAMKELGGEWTPIPAGPIRQNPANPTANMRVVNASGADITTVKPSKKASSKSTSKAVAANAPKKKKSGQSVRTASTASSRARSDDRIGG
jgi:hypothetical protein